MLRVAASAMYCVHARIVVRHAVALGVERQICVARWDVAVQVGEDERHALLA